MKTIYLIAFLFITSFCSYANVSVVNGLTHVYSGMSGDVITGEVVLINYSESEERVTFSIGEAIYSCTKSRIFTNEITHSFSSSSWFNSNVNERVLAPKEKYVLKYTITIPKDEALNGSYWSVLMVSVENPIKEEVLTNKIGLDTKIQYAIGLITNVNAVDNVDIDFENVLAPSNEDKNLHIKVKNNGNFAEATSLSLEVYNQQGSKIKEYETKRLLVFPEVCRDYQLNISDLPKGEYECVLVAEARESFTGANIKLNID